jgi:hypothetical protein
MNRNFFFTALGATFLALASGCNDSVEALSSSPPNTAGSAGVAGAAGASGMAGTGGTAGQGGSGAGQGGSAGSSAGSGGSGGSGGSAGQGGAGQGGSAGSAGGGQAGSGALEGCLWFEKLLEKNGSPTGIVRLGPGGAKKQVLPAQTDDKPGVDSLVKIVDVTDTHVFAVGTAGNDAQALVALKIDEKTGDFQEFRYLDGGLINVLEFRFPYTMWSAGNSTPYLYYTVPEGNGLSLRRVSRSQPEAGPETLATNLVFDSEPFKVMQRGKFPPYSDELLLASADRIAWIRKNKPVQEIQVGWAEVFVTGFTIEGNDLYYATRYAGSTQGQVHRAEIDESSGFLESVAPVSVNNAGALISFPDGGEAPAVALITEEGLWKFHPYEDGLDAGGFVKLPAMNRFQIEYGIHPTRFEYGYFLDAMCEGGFVVPTFLPDPFFVSNQPASLVARATEPGFPFVSPTPWSHQYDAGTNGLHGNKHGIYVVR